MVLRNLKLIFFYIKKATGIDLMDLQPVASSDLPTINLDQLADLFNPVKPLEH